MVSTRLSDAELRQLVQDDGQMAPGAREELERRHFLSVRQFAFAASPYEGDRLAEEAWDQALRPLDEDITGAVRPRALAAVLRKAAEWHGAGRAEALAAELADWFEPDVTEDGTDGTGGTAAAAGMDPMDVPAGMDAIDVMDAAQAPLAAAGASSRDQAAGPGAVRLARFRSSSVTARAFERLPARSQTVLWHHEVEHDDEAAIRELLGSDAEDVTLLDRRARRELYNAYVSLHQDETVDDACRRLHRMLLAYAEQTTMNTPGDLVSHLDRCAHCARAVDDLERMRFEFGSVLAEALLPWGGADYALSADTVDAMTFDAAPGGAAGAARPKTASTRAWAAAGPGGGRLLGGLRTCAASLPGVGPIVNFAAGEDRSPRARRAALAAALVGLCSLVVAVAYTGGLREGAENSAGSRPGDSPGGSQTTATATSTVTATRPPGRNGYTPSSPVRGAAVEWLFDAVDQGRTVDTSGEGKDGTLDGDPLPEPADGAIEFAGQQSVVSEGPVVNTSRSFTVSARAKLDDTESFQTVVSQDASRISGFAVQYDPDSDRWEMIAPEEDEEEADLVQAGGPPGPPADKWTHLTGVYDARAGEIRLYVDGKLEDTASLGAREEEPPEDGGASPSPSPTSGDGSGGDGGSGGDAGGDASSGGDVSSGGGGDGGFGGGWGGGPGGPGGFGGGGGGRPGGGGFFGGPAGEVRHAAGTAPRSVQGATRAAVIRADGDFAVGRSLSGDQFERGFDGAIDDVRAFERALTAKEIAKLAGR